MQKRVFDKTKCMYFFTKDEKLLKIYNKIWKKVSNIIKKVFDSRPVYNKKYPKNKIKTCNGKINTNFHNNKIPKEGCKIVFLSVILIDSIYRKKESYYPLKTLKEECKYVVKEKKEKKSLLLRTCFFLLVL